MYQFALITPPILFGWSTDAGIAAKRVLYLEDLIPAGYAPLPDEVQICRVLGWRQKPWECPAYGDVTVGIDYDRRFKTLSGFPAAENVDPDLLTCALTLEFAPGRPRASWITHDPPLLYRKGLDCIIVAPEIAGTVPGESFDVRIAFYVMLDAPFPLAAP